MSQQRCADPVPSFGAMFRFFIPLAMTSFLILLSHALMNAGIARLSKPELYLAAFALAKSLYQVLQAPTMIVRQCISGLTRDCQSYLVSRRVFTWVVLAVTGVFLIVCYSPIGLFIFERLMGNPRELSYAALLMMRVIMWLQFAWLMRDGYGPVAIRLRETYILPTATFVRTVFTMLCVFILFRCSFAHDVLLPGIIFTLTGFIEGITVLAMVKFRIRDYLARLDFLPRAEETVRTLTARQVVVFSFPVLIMSLLRSFSDPVINTGLAHTAAPELALAAYAVGWSVVLCVLDTSGMLHQVVLGFMDAQYRNRIRILQFSGILAAIQIAALAVMVFTPLGAFILRDLLGSGEALTRMALGVMAVALPLPLVVNLREYYWGVAMLERKTRWMSTGKIVQLVSLSAGVLLLVLPGGSLSNPALIAPLALAVSMLAEALTLAVVHYRLKGRL